MNPYQLIQIILAVLLIGGSAVTSLGGATIQCLATKDCSPAAKMFGNMIFSPQERISKAVDALQDTNALAGIPLAYREDYIANQKQQIFFGFLVSMLWIWLGYWIFSKLPAMQDLGTKIVVLLFVLVSLGFVQSIYSMIVNGTFTIPYIGFFKLFLHPDVLVMTAQKAVEIGKDVASPLS